MALFGSQWFANAGSSAYDVDNSAMFNEPDDEYFTRTPTSASNQRTWTFSTWIKRGNLGSDQRIFTAASNGGELFFDANDKLNAYQYEGGYTWNYISTQVFRDPHAWYHIVQRVDTTQGSSGDRVRLYVNGEQITAFDTSTAPSQNATGYVNSAVAHYIGRYSGSNSMHYDGYLAETILIDSQSLAPASFGETDDNGVWRPIEVSSSGLFDASNSVVPTATTWTLGSTMSAGTGTLDKSGAGGTSALYARMLEGNFKVTFTAAALNDALFGVFDYTEIGTFNASQDDGFLDSMTNSFWYDEGQTDVNYGNSTVAASKTIAAGSVVTIERSGSTIKITDDGSDVHEFTQTFSGPVGFIAGHRNTGANSLDFNSISFDGVSGIGKNGFYLPFTSSTLLGEDYGNGSGLVDRTSGTLTGDFTQNGGNAAAFDGNYAQASGSAARKGGGTSTAFLMKDHGSGVTKTITGFRVFGCTDQGFHSDNDSDTVAVKLQGSANGTDFTDLGTLSFTDPGNASPQGKFTGITTSTAYRYHKLLFTFDTATGGKLVGEAELYEGSNPSGGNNFTAVNAPTQTSDSPTKNYAVLSPLTHQTNGSLSKGNTTTTTASADQGLSFSTFPVTTGQKVYIEALCSGATSCMTGCVKATSAVVQNPLSDFDALESADGGAGRLLHVGLGDVFNSDGNTTASNYAPNDSVPVTHMIALDLVNDKIYWGDAGVGASGWSNGSGSFNQSFDNATGVDLTANLDWFFAFRPFAGTIEVNFGATAFTVSPPTGYSSGYSAAIENENRETALTTEDGSAYFQTTLYTGNGASSHEINQSGENSTFAPDFLWTKGITTTEHRITDAIRGATKVFFTDSSLGDSASTTETTSVLSLDSDGFTVGSGGGVNGSGQAKLAWQWKAGDSNTTVSASGSGDGAINACTHRANQTAGFSLVKYEGANSQISNGQDTKVTHGLGAKPELALIKNIDDTHDWMVLSTSTTGFASDSQTGDDAHLHLNTDDNVNGSLYTGHFETGSDSTHFEVGNDNGVNKNGDEYMAYLFRSIPGYSRVGSYTGGTNSTNGVCVNIGFRPAWLMLKNYKNSGESWYVFDNQRPGYNDENNQLIPNSTAAEGAGNILDILSNGFKIRANDRAYGGSTSSDGYIYLAFAENPFAGTSPATAR
jgi:hypothetical protein